MIEALKIDVGENGKKFILENIEKILNTDYEWTNGNYVKQFEKEFEKITGARYASAVSSGSSAIEIALSALEMNEDCIAFVPTLTAPPTVYSCLHAGLKVVYVDSNSNDFGMDINDLKRKIMKYKCNMRGVVIPVHIGGIVSNNIEKIIKIAKYNGLYVIEDCAHAHGSKFSGIHAGKHGIIGTFSFFLTKVLTSGEGGIIITDDPELDKKFKIIRNYGKFDGKHILNGSSWRMNEFTAVVALWQTKNLNKITSDRQKVAAKYDQLLKNNLKCHSLILDSKTESSYYKYIVMLDKNINKNILKHMMKEKYGITLAGEVYETPCHMEPIFQKNEKILNKEEHFITSENIAIHHICLPMYPTLSDQEINYIINSLNESITIVSRNQL